MQPDTFPKPTSGVKTKIIISSMLIVAAVVYLVISSTRSNIQYFLTVDEVLSRGGNLAGKNIRISGVVLGDSIHYDSQSQLLTFTIAHIPGDEREVEKAGGLAAVLHAAAADPTRQTIHIVYIGIRPDLLKNEAQAILSGTIQPDGSFKASEVLLKCPTRYDQSVPGQTGKK